MAKKKTSRKTRPAIRRASTKRTSRKAEPATKYSRDYPIAGGHNYLVRSIPRKIWKDASTRSKGERRSIRNVIIQAIALYAAGKFSALAEHKPEVTPVDASTDHPVDLAPATPATM